MQMDLCPSKEGGCPRRRGDVAVEDANNADSRIPKVKKKIILTGVRMMMVSE
jgi:hypothetical protein